MTELHLSLSGHGKGVPSPESEDYFELEGKEIFINTGSHLSYPILMD